MVMKITLGAGLRQKLQQVKHRLTGRSARADTQPAAPPQSAQIVASLVVAFVIYAVGANIYANWPASSASRLPGPTGAGDERLLSGGKVWSLGAGDIVCRERLRVLRAVTTNPAKIDDGKMLRIGECKQPDVVLYSRPMETDGTEHQLFVKLGTGLYLPVRISDE
jgi:hypothetical protein